MVSQRIGTNNGLTFWVRAATTTRARTLAAGQLWYLVISESIRVHGKSTTPNIANLGNVGKIPANQVADLIDGLIRWFELQTHALSEGTEIRESLE